MSVRDTMLCFVEYYFIISVVICLEYMGADA